MFEFSSSVTVCCHSALVMCLNVHLLSLMCPDKQFYHLPANEKRVFSVSMWPLRLRLIPLHCFLWSFGWTFSSNPPPGSSSSGRVWLNETCFLHKRQQAAKLLLSVPVTSRGRYFLSYYLQTDRLTGCWFPSYLSFTQGFALSWGGLCNQKCTKIFFSFSSGLFFRTVSFVRHTKGPDFCFCWV